MYNPFPSYRSRPLLTNFLILNATLYASLFSVFFLWQKPGLAALCVALPGIVLLLYAHSWKLLLTYLFFAIGGTLQEAYFTGQSLWVYDTSSFFALPLYLPFVWGTIGLLAIGALKGLLLLENRLPLFHHPPRFAISATATLLFLAASLWGIATYAATPLALVGFFLAIDALYLFAMGSVPLAVVGVVAMIIGSLADLLSVSLGIWHYPPSFTFAGVPLYIFVGWDVVGLLIGGFYLTLDTPDTPFSKKNKRGKS